ncbi:MAG TPA: TetR/AcrR family transcriptional regulator [Acidobacteriaceae bacterium]
MKETRSSEQPTRHQVKTEATLRGLLDAAETIFVRDGYERAQIETIAAEAGRTKGAIYAHFQSKEEIFFALLERRITKHRELIIPSVQEVPVQHRIEVMKELFLSFFEDENWHILMLEFKLFALRNKASLRRVQELYQLAYDWFTRALLPKGEGFTDAQKDRVLIALAILRGIPSGVLLEKQFNPVLNSPGAATPALEAIFDSLLNPRALKPRSKNK